MFSLSTFFCLISEFLWICHIRSSNYLYFSINSFVMLFFSFFFFFSCFKNSIVLLSNPFTFYYEFLFMPNTAWLSNSDTCPIFTVQSTDFLTFSTVYFLLNSAFENSACEFILLDAGTSDEIISFSCIFGINWRFSSYFCFIFDGFRDSLVSKRENWFLRNKGISYVFMLLCLNEF